MVHDGAYSVRERPGAGGQAVIYRAVNKDGTTVILKAYQPVPGEGLEVMIESARSFENESSLLGQLDHDGIVRLEDMFYEDSRVYLVLEHVEGTSLRQLVSDGGPLQEERVLELSRQVCRILQYLHEKNPSIIHRDFTPDDLLLTADGKLKLIDFSVAQTGKDVKRGECAGKHAFTPPEQFRGEACPQSDIYALGATMFFLLTGKDPEPISQSSPVASTKEISAELSEIVEVATSLALEERYETITWMSSALESASCSRQMREQAGSCPGTDRDAHAREALPDNGSAQKADYEPGMQDALTLGFREEHLA